MISENAVAGTERQRIHVLPADVAARIAAGEVVERPVSVVRELLDNAIDAGARRISIEIEEGGIRLIRVVDDGRGMAPEDVELAFERHATSKIARIDDLSAVRTLGFRGEALPSIAAAGDVELTTRTAAEPVGVHLVLADGRPVRRTARPAPAGTSFAVRELFGRLPARRKFLASPAAETRQVSVLVSHYALAYPAIAFALSINGRRALSTSGDGQLRHAFAAVYGAESAQSMLAVELHEEGLAVEGLAGPPSLHRGNRAAISIFINGRWVQSRSLVFSVADAYQSQLPIGRHPFAALRVTVPGQDVDVNVHPAKAEVRFRDERLVARAVRHAVLAALEGAGPVAWSLEPEAGEAQIAGQPPLRERLALSQAATPRDPSLLLRPPAPLQASFAPPAPEASASPGVRPHREVLPLLRVVGQMGSTYIVAEGPDGMYLIDQHAAHERVVYDRLVSRRSEARPDGSQALLDPALVELDVVQAATLSENLDALGTLGLVVEPFGERSFLVRETPPGMGAEIATSLVALLDKLAGERRVEDPFGRAAATVACHSSVRAGMALAMEEMRQLVADLEKTAQPRTCPHGRPTLIHVSTDMLERQFGRR